MVLKRTRERKPISEKKDVRSGVISGRVAVVSESKSAADLEELRKVAVRAERAWRSVEATGGLLALADIAARWGVGKETVRAYRDRRDDFPEPVATIGRSEVWTAASVDLWRATPRRAGRRPKEPRP
jgi:predicted DNA-binding transcriptional regulator AlpA